MKLATFFAGALLFVSALPARAQSSQSQPPPDKTHAAPQTSPAAAAAQDAGTAKKKPKKVWTNDEISSVKGNVSVVGDASAPVAGKSSQEPDADSATPGAPTGQQIADFRDRLLQLRVQLEIIDKKISDLRSFKAEDTSAAGGINIKHGYSMTPVAEQIKQLQEKKKQVETQIDAMEELARKNGIDPGRLR
jgi:hypothetical protein